MSLYHCRHSACLHAYAVRGIVLAISISLTLLPGLAAAELALGSLLWSVENIVDNDDAPFGLDQGPGSGEPRSVRGLALSPDGAYLYLGYNADKQVRKIDLSVLDPADSCDNAAELYFGSGCGGPGYTGTCASDSLDNPKAIATDDAGRVYVTRSSAIEIYDADLSALLLSITGFATTNGIHVMRRDASSLFIYASDRGSDEIYRLVVNDTAIAGGGSIARATALDATFDGDGIVHVGLDAAGAATNDLRGLAVDFDGNVWAAENDGTLFHVVPAAGEGASTVSRRMLASAFDVAIDGDQVFVSTSGRTVTVIDRNDLNSTLATLAPPLASLDVAAKGSVTGIDVLPGQALFVSIEDGSSSPLSAESPFSDVNCDGSDPNNHADDDNDPVLVADVVNCPTSRYVSETGDDASGYNDCTDSGAPCATIQHAVDVACPSGDTVDIAAGTYNEEVVIEKPLTILGAGCAATTIVGSTSSYPGGPFFTVFEIMADDVTIHDLSVLTDWIAFQAHDPEWDGGANVPDNTEIYNTCVSGGGQALDGWSPGTGLLFHDNTATGGVMNDVFWTGEDAEIANNTFSGSEQSSILLWDISSLGTYAPITAASIHDNVITAAQSCPARSTDFGVISIVDLDGTAAGSVSIADNVIADGFGTGITLLDCATNISVSGNTITGQTDVWETDNGAQCVFGGTPDPAYVQAAHGIRFYGNNAGVVAVGATISGNYIGETPAGVPAANEGSGVQLDNPDGGAISVSGNVLNNNAAGLVVGTGAWSLDVDKNYIAANLATGIDVNAASSGMLSCNRILGNDTGIVSASSGAAANDNTIAGNVAVGLDATAVSAPPLMDGVDNYWGCVSGVNTGACDTAVGNVDLTPAASSEPLCVTCSGAGGDTDDDGVCDPLDNCVSAPNADQLDGDGDGAGDVCDACPNDADDDIDADGVCGDIDNCPLDANADQADADADGVGDVCDSLELLGSITISRVVLKADTAKSSRLEGRVRIMGVVVNVGDGAQFATDLTSNGDVVIDLTAGAYAASIPLGACEERANGKIIKCDNGDSRAFFKLLTLEGNVFPGDYTMAIRLKNHDDVDGPSGPVNVRLSQPTVSYEREDDISNCRGNRKGNRLVCEER